MAPLPPELAAALHRMGLPGGEHATVGEGLTGGVSSDIWRVDLPGGPVCLKRALPRLRVAADWQAPVERSRYEARWMRRANAVVPGMAPALLAEDAASFTLAMAWLDPVNHPVWKAELHAGRADPNFAAETGRRLGRLHAATAAEPALAAQFPTDAIFHAIRLEPYLLATGRAHPDLAPALERLTAVTAGMRRALVHGDVSPKNILAGPNGPVFLDAECAWWGDPAFDLAFCLNHLLLKCLWTPAAAARFLACFAALAASYLPHVTWEDAAALEARAAALLPGLLLARVDGKSPVEYITREAERETVRAVASRLLLSPVARLDDVRAAWARQIGVSLA